VPNPCPNVPRPLGSGKRTGVAEWLNHATFLHSPPQPAIRKEYKASFRVEPTYPRQAISAGVTGKVIAWVRVAPNGTVQDVQIRESSNRIFDREVIRALSQWKFNPEPVGFIGEYEIVFNLKD